MRELLLFFHKGGLVVNVQSQSWAFTLGTPDHRDC